MTTRSARHDDSDTLPADGGREGPHPRAGGLPSEADPRDVRLPAGEFLWAMLEAPGQRAAVARHGAIRCARPLPPGLVPALAEQVHADPDTLIAVAAPVDDRHLLVCALERDRVEAARDHALTLGPADLPPCVATLAPEAACFDLLVGPALPRAAHRRARVRHGLGALALALWSLLLALGLARRAERWERAAREARDRADLVALAVDPGTTQTGLTLADLPFLAETARAARGGADGQRAPRPVGPVLADVVAHWPSQAPPTSLRIDGKSILASALVPGEPGAFLSALTPPPGWRLREPRLSALDEKTQVTLVLERETGAAP